VVRAYRGLSKGWRSLEYYCPVGLNDGSLAIYCQEWTRERSVPLGYGVIVAWHEVPGKRTKKCTVPYGMWQQGYGAFSVGISQIPETIRYIEQQAEHHRTRTF
jgi:hypothetical protein